MDREAAVIRSEMTQTRIELDSKLSQLETRARELTPRRYLKRHLSNGLVDRLVGGARTGTRAAIAWGGVGEQVELGAVAGMSSHRVEPVVHGRQIQTLARRAGEGALELLERPLFQGTVAFVPRSLVERSRGNDLVYRPGCHRAQS